MKKTDKLTNVKLKEILINEVSLLPKKRFEKLLYDKTIKYMFYHKEGKNQCKGYCCCGADDIILEKPKSGKFIKCPCCKKQVKLKNDIYNNNELEVTISSYVEPCSVGFIERLYMVHNKFSYDSKASPRCQRKISYREEQRSLLTFEGKKLTIHEHKNYSFGMWKSNWITGRAPKHGIGWSGWWAEDLSMNILLNNKNMFNNSPFRYAEINKYIDNIKYDLFWYLKRYLEIPQIELVIKNKLYKLAFQILNSNDWHYHDYKNFFNSHGKTLESMCGLRKKDDIEFCAKNNFGSIEIAAYLFVKEQQWKKITKEEVKFIARIMDQDSRNGKLSSKFIDYISYEKIYKYYLKNKKEYENPIDFLRDYRDYTNAARELGMNMEDTKVKIPRDFRYCHDLCMSRYKELLAQRREKEKKEKNKTFSELALKYKEIFEKRSVKYSIVVPSTLEDLEHEGEENHNCVGSYGDRILNETSIVVFLRETDNIEKSFCTVEIDPDDYKIVQCRSKSNGRAPEDAQNWLSKQINKIKTKLQIQTT